MFPSESVSESERGRRKVGGMERGRGAVSCVADGADDENGNELAGSRCAYRMSSNDAFAQSMEKMKRSRSWSTCTRLLS